MSWEILYFVDNEKIKSVKGEMGEIQRRDVH